MSDPVAVVREYFRLADAGDRAVFDLFTMDAEISFPKFGTGHGPGALKRLTSGLRLLITDIRHEVDKFRVSVDGTTVVVEGTSSGTTSDGRPWDGQVGPGGKFCSVFEVRGAYIARMAIYLDPDYACADTGRCVWGKE